MQSNKKKNPLFLNSISKESEYSQSKHETDQIAMATELFEVE